MAVAAVPAAPIAAAPTAPTAVATPVVLAVGWEDAKPPMSEVKAPPLVVGWTDWHCPHATGPSSAAATSRADSTAHLSAAAAGAVLPIDVSAPHELAAAAAADGAAAADAATAAAAVGAADAAGVVGAAAAAAAAAADAADAAGVVRAVVAAAAAAAADAGDAADAARVVGAAAAAPVAAADAADATGVVGAAAAAPVAAADAADATGVVGAAAAAVAAAAVVLVLAALTPVSPPASESRRRSNLQSTPQVCTRKLDFQVKHKNTQCLPNAQSEHTANTLLGTPQAHCRHTPGTPLAYTSRRAHPFLSRVRSNL